MNFFSMVSALIALAAVSSYVNYRHIKLPTTIGVMPVSLLMTPGLTVIIDAIKESRNIFLRMNSYAIYRIAETLRVLLFMTLAILVFNFHPLTAVMIVMLGVATVLGLIGPVAAFGLFYIGEREYHLDRARIQTLMYLMLSVAGHLTIFLTRTRGAFWTIRPAPILWIAVLGTQIIATLIAVYGVFMTPLGWGWAAFVWGYALLWLLVSDRVKLMAYRVFDPTAQPLLEKKQSDVTAQITKRAYELYEQHGHSDGRADQDWPQAEREVRNTGATQ